MKSWLTVAEAAEYSGVSRDTIYTACERREIRHARVGGRRAIRLKPEWIDAWLEQHTRGGRHSACNNPDAPVSTGAVSAYSGAKVERGTLHGNDAAVPTNTRPTSRPQRGHGDGC
jgi:excisionase family DNA binding protein